MKCPFCDQEINDAAKFCNKCGKKIPRCASCGAFIPSRVRFCTACGVQVPEDALNLFETTQKTTSEAPENSVPTGEEKASFYHDPNEPEDQTEEEEPSEKKRKISLPLLILIIVLAALVVTVVVLFACGVFSSNEPVAVDGDEVTEEIDEPEEELSVEEESLPEEPEPADIPEEEIFEEDVEEEEEVIIYSVTMPTAYQQLEEGESVTLVTETEPFGAELIWTSSDPSVATVDSGGTVTAVGAGQCTVTATCAADADASEYCVIYVPEKVHTYELVIADVTWDEAMLLAQEAGGHLVTITSEEEYETVCALADSSENYDLRYLWLGATAGSNGWTGEDCWITGETWSFENWYPGEPSGQDTDGTPENCLCMWQVGDTGWTFNDQRNDLISVLPSVAGKIGYVIEYE